jgi:hypothetical protein
MLLQVTAALTFADLRFARQNFEHVRIGSLTAQTKVLLP